MAKCSLCGGTLDQKKICTFCGLDNTKNDDQYKGMLNRNNCDGKPLTHVHEHAQGKSGNARKQTNQKNAATVIGFIVAIISIISTIYGFIEDAFYEEVRVETTYETYLEPGSYAVGTHIPAGTYTLEIDTGEWGLVEIQEHINEEIYMEEYFYMSIDDEDRIEDIYLGENNVLSIPTGLTLFVYSPDADTSMLTTQANPLTTSYSISQTSVAGVDFPAGVYDIVFDLEYPDDAGTVSYQIMNPMSGLVMMERSQMIDSDNTVFRNLTLTEGSVIWLEGLERVIIQPSEVVNVME